MSDQPTTCAPCHDTGRLESCPNCEKFPDLAQIGACDHTCYACMPRPKTLDADQQQRLDTLPLLREMVAKAHRVTPYPSDETLRRVLPQSPEYAPLRAEPFFGVIRDVVRYFVEVTEHLSEQGRHRLRDRGSDGLDMVGDAATGDLD